jgi:pyruvate/2-oxoglutarate dehydrogenase complex dihydrolipoamide dehydrogenase (E3) component
VGFVHAGNWLDMTERPDHVAMIGAGAIGLEMAQFLVRMGAQVTVIELSGQIAGHEDADIAAAMQHLLAAEGIGFRLQTPVKRVAAREGGVAVWLGDDAAPLTASHLFVAAGRKPNTDDLGLETVGVATERGIIRVDERLASSVPNIWAAGDVRGGPQFTHTAWDDHRVLVSQLIGDGARTTRRVVPYAIFTDPELGRVGMTEAQAREAGRTIRIGRFEMSRSGKAAEIGEDLGVIKVIVDAASSEILGAAVLAAHGAELVHGYVELMNAHAPCQVMRDAVHIHPTLFEAVQSAVLAI